MIVEPSDRELVKWAVDHSVPWYYAHEHGLPDPCLRIQYGHLTAYFCRGRLTRLWAHADEAFLDDMFQQLLELFDLCGPARRILFPGRNVSRSGRRALWDDPPELA